MHRIALLPLMHSQPLRWLVVCKPLMSPTPDSQRIQTPANHPNRTLVSPTNNLHRTPKADRVLQAGLSSWILMIL